MTVSRLRAIPGIGVDRVGDAADRLANPAVLRLENLDTDLAPPALALARTHQAIDEEAANSYLPFQGHDRLRAVATAHVARLAGDRYDWRTDCVITAGGLNGITNVLLATLEPADEVVMAEPIYAGLVNRVLLAGGVPVFVPMHAGPTGWHVEPGALTAAVTGRTRALLLMSPSMPTGAVLGEDVWREAAAVAVERDLWLIVDAAMERIRFDGGTPCSPAAFGDEVASRTITVGAASKELRLIGWRVGWVVGPTALMADVHTVGLTNVVCPVGIAQQGVAAALAAPEADSGVAAAAAVLRERRDVLLGQLDGFAVAPPAGGWSLLIDCRPLGLDAAAVAARLLEWGRIAATPMTGWGPSGAHFVRFVFANEPVDRLRDVGRRMARALG